MLCQRFVVKELPGRYVAELFELTDRLVCKKVQE